MRPRMRRRGVGVLGSMAIGGVAYAAGSSAAKSGAREQQEQERLAALEAQQMAQAAPPPAPVAQPSAPPAPTASGKSLIDQLKELGELRDSGILTPAEFDAAKQKLLAS